jgi:steroid delta-isomerase-like uncharacterized protein
MTSSNIDVIRRAIDEIYNQGKLDVVDEVVSQDFVFHATSGDMHGPAEVKQYVTMLRTAFPDLRFTIDDQIASGDQVVTRWTATGTHLGPFQGIPPTGKNGRITGVDIDRMKNGKAVECWTSSDELGLLQQLGVVPAPEPATAG